MATGFTTSEGNYDNTDLADIFASLTGTKLTTNVGYISKATGTDLTNSFEPIGTTTAVPATGYKSTPYNADLSNIFMKKPPFTFTEGNTYHQSQITIEGITYEMIFFTTGNVKFYSNYPIDIYRLLSVASGGYGTPDGSWLNYGGYGGQVIIKGDKGEYNIIYKTVPKNTTFDFKINTVTNSLNGINNSSGSCSVTELDFYVYSATGTASNFLPVTSENPPYWGYGGTNGTKPATSEPVVKYPAPGVPELYTGKDYGAGGGAGGFARPGLENETLKMGQSASTAGGGGGGGGYEFQGGGFGGYYGIPKTPDGYGGSPGGIGNPGTAGGGGDISTYFSGGGGGGGAGGSGVNGGVGAAGGAGGAGGTNPIVIGAGGGGGGGIGGHGGGMGAYYLDAYFIGINSASGAGGPGVTFLIFRY